MLFSFSSLRSKRSSSARLALLSLLQLSLFISLPVQAQTAAPDPTQRMMVILAPSAVAAQRVGPNDRLDNIFPDQRVQERPRA